MNTDLWITHVKYRTRAEAYARIEQIDINRLRNHLIDMYGEEYVAKLSDDEARGEIRNLADYIYPDSLATKIDGTAIVDIEGRLYLFAGGLTGGQDTPSEEFDMMCLLEDMGIDED